MGEGLTSKAMCEGPCRPNVEAMLRDRARRMHAEAVRLEKLADVAGHIGAEAEEALYQLVSMSR